jgi:hypothetical protein
VLFGAMSSGVMLKTNDIFVGNAELIDRDPERLPSSLSEVDARRHEVLAVPVQDLSLELFTSLEANDVLFIDSSHVVKVGTDVVHLVTSVLPRLRRGVLINFHDVFCPFEYPEAWVRAGRAWSENYILKAFLQFNAAFELLFFNPYLGAPPRRGGGATLAIVPEESRRRPLDRKNRLTG